MKKCKQILSVLLSSIMLVSITTGLKLTAYAETDGDFMYNVTSIYAEIINYTGSDSEINIPSTLGGYKVTSIGDNAFYRCSNLTSVTIPDSVTNIGWCAFFGCSSLTSITIPNSVTNIESSAFSDCSSLTSVAIGKSVTSIGQFAFAGCINLTNITIPNSVTSINDCVFRYCSSLTSATIGSSVTSIGFDVFSNCDSLESITVSAENTVYDSRDNCNAIIETATNKLIIGCKNTVIPNSVAGIGSSAFSGCNSLTSITIPNRVSSIGDLAFSGCSGLKSITVSAENTVYDSRDNCNAIIETATNKLIIGCKNTVIPNSVVGIGNSAFFGCSGLTNITLPKSIKSIDMYAFFGCDSLTDVYYYGEKEDWEKIEISEVNDRLTGATINYVKENTESVTQPTTAPTVKKISIAKAGVSGIKSKTYTGKALTQSITVKLGKTTLKSGKDYAASYRNNKKVGAAIVIITGKGAYEGTITKNFKINPKATTISKLTAKKKSFTVKWKKQAAQTTGYQIQYSTSGKFKKAKTITVKSNKSVSITKKGLKAKKKYYVRIRTYKRVNGKNYYSAWSKAKAVTAKK